MSAKDLKTDDSASYSTRINGWTKCLGETKAFYFTHRSPNLLSMPRQKEHQGIRLTYIEARGSFSSCERIVQRPHRGRTWRFGLSEWVAPLMNFFRQGRSQKLVTLFVDFGLDSESLIFELQSDTNTLELLVVHSGDIEQESAMGMSQGTTNSQSAVTCVVERIVQNAKRGINHKDSADLLRDLKATLTEDNYKDVEAEILQAISPTLITAHGYSRGLAHLNQVKLLEDASTIITKLKSFGYPSFINSGTLLGFVRERQLIGHDDDLDLGVLLHGADEAEVSRSWIKAVNLMAKNFPLVKKSNEIATIKIQDGVEVDLFPAWVLDERLFVYPYCNGALRMEAILPIKEENWQGCTVSLPQNPELLLEINYGRNWRTPDKTWRFDWKLAGIAFESFVRTNKHQLTSGLE